MSIADPDDPIVEEVKEIVAQDPEAFEEFKKVSEETPNQEMLQIVQEIQNHIQEKVQELSQYQQD